MYLNLMEVLLATASLQQNLHKWRANMPRSKMLTGNHRGTGSWHRHPRKGPLFVFSLFPTPLVTLEPRTLSKRFTSLGGRFRGCSPTRNVLEGHWGGAGGIEQKIKGCISLEVQVLCAQCEPVCPGLHTGVSVPLGFTREPAQPKRLAQKFTSIPFGPNHQ